VVKRESSEKGFPYLLGTQLLGRAVGVENFHSVSEWGPEILKSVIEDVFKRVTVVIIQCNPGMFFSVVDRNVCRGYKSAGEGAARQDPTKLDAEDQEEAVDMSGKVFMRLDAAVFKCGIVRWKVGFAPGAMTVVIAVGSAARATAQSTTSSRSVILTVRHVAATVSKTRKVNAGTTAGEGAQKRACRRNHSVGEPVRDVCTDQRCGKCPPGFSDTLGVQVRPVGVYVGNVVLLRL
jgi:hypothetical protein